MPNRINALQEVFPPVLDSAVSLGDNIRRFRTRLRPKVNQTTFARRCGVEQSAVSNWETNKSQPKPSELPKIAHVLGVSVEDLLQGIDEDYDAMRKPTTPATAHLSIAATPYAVRTLKEFNRDLPGLEDRDIAYVLDWLRFFTRQEPRNDAGPSDTSGGVPRPPRSKR